jgi:hypothetical protein
MLIAAAAIALIGASSALAHHGELTADEIKKTLVGSKARYTNDKGVTFEMRFEEDGSAKLTGDNSFSDTGNWNIDGDRFCEQWKRFRHGEKACWTVRHMKSDNYSFEGSNEAADVKATISK